MTQSKKDTYDIIAWVLFTVGLLLFLNATHSSGEALERFRIIFSASADSLTGAILVVLAIVALIILHFSDIKRISKHQ